MGLRERMVSKRGRRSMTAAPMPSHLRFYLAIIAFVSKNLFKWNGKEPCQAPLLNGAKRFVLCFKVFVHLALH